MREILESEHGVVFHQKREIDLPSIPEDKLRILVGDEKLDYAPESLNFLIEYAESQAVSDQWGNRHEERRKWRQQMASEYGQPFLDVYYSRNQLRLNQLSLARLEFKDLPGYLREAGNNELAGRLKTIADEVDNKIRGIDLATSEQTGKSYKEMSLDEKLEVVHLVEDKIIEVFDLLSS